MVHRKSEYRLSFKWLPVDLCRTGRVASADYRTYRRRADLAHTDWLVWSGGDNYWGPHGTAACACDCDDDDDDGGGERHLPTTRNRQRHNELVEQWGRRHEHQHRPAVIQPKRPATTAGAYNAGELMTEPLADERRPAAIGRSLQLTSPGLPASAQSAKCPDQDRTVRITEDQAVQTQTDFAARPRTASIDYNNESDRKGTTRPARNCESISSSRRLFNGQRYALSEGRSPAINDGRHTGDARRKKMTDIGPVAVDPRINYPQKTKRIAALPAGGDHHQRRHGHPPAPSISHAWTASNTGQVGHWTSAEKVNHNHSPPVYGYWTTDDAKSERKRRSTLPRSASTSHLAAGPLTVNHSSIWMSEYRRHFS